MAESDAQPRPVCPTHGSEHTIEADYPGPMGVSLGCSWSVWGENPYRLLDSCDWSEFYPIGPRHRGFLSPGVKSNDRYGTKLPVLKAIAKLEVSDRAFRRAIVEETGLSVGAVTGALRRNTLYGFIEKSLQRRPLLPEGSAFTFTLTERGVGFLRFFDVDVEVLRNGKEEA